MQAWACVLVHTHDSHKDLVYTYKRRVSCSMHVLFCSESARQKPNVYFARTWDGLLRPASFSPASCVLGLLELSEIGYRSACSATCSALLALLLQTYLVHGIVCSSYSTCQLAAALLQMFAGHKGPVRCGKFSPDGRTVATGGGEGDASLKIWDPKTGTCTHSIQGHGFHTAGVPTGTGQGHLAYMALLSRVCLVVSVCRCKGTLSCGLGSCDYDAHCISHES